MGQLGLLFTRFPQPNAGLSPLVCSHRHNSLADICPIETLQNFATDCAGFGFTAGLARTTIPFLCSTLHVKERPSAFRSETLGSGDEPFLEIVPRRNTK
jgi:hypothetical protein